MVPSERPKSSKTLCFHCFFEPLASQDGTHFGAILGSILGPHRQAAASRFRPKWPKILAKGLIWPAQSNTLFQVKYFFRSDTFFRLQLSLISFQLTTPAGLRGVEILKSWKSFNSSFQLNYWISRGLEILVMHIGWFPCDFAF